MKRMLILCGALLVGVASPAQPTLDENWPAVTTP